MIDTDKYWTPDVALSDDETTDCVQSNVGDELPSKTPNHCETYTLSTSVRSITWLLLLGSSAVTVVTAVLVKNSLAYFDYLIACSLGLWLGWRILLN